MSTFLYSVVSVIGWALANLVYVDLRRKGIGGFGRRAAFWFGFPGTWVSMIVEDEGSALEIEHDDDDEERILKEIRQDREARGLIGPSEVGERTRGEHGAQG